MEIMNKMIFLNFPLTTDDPTPPAIPRPEFTPFMSLVKGDDANVTTITVVSHTGTHVDAPWHVIKDGITITDFQANELIFDHPAVFDLALKDEQIVMPEDLLPFVKLGKESDLLLFRFGYGPVRRSDPSRYSQKCPGFGVESAEFLLQNFPKTRCVGMDVPSLACIASLDKTMKAHNVLLAGNDGRFLVIEDMNLDQDLSGLHRVILAPWLIKNLDGGPATIFGEIG
jgi:kynurenine formamidase